MEILLRIGGALMRLLYWLLGPLFHLSENYKKKVVPEPKDPLLFVSATELARKIRKGELQSSEVVSAYIQRVKEVNIYLNAVVEDRFKAALHEAREIDNYISNQTELSENELKMRKPLLGVPVTIKESCQVKDMEFSIGNMMRMNLKAPEDGEAVRLLRAAGAVPILISNTPEYCLSWTTVNYVTGNACNPYNTCRTPGGSSGGEGALLGAGASVIGLGSDLAGSVRVPALFNGVFGHKPTAGIVSINGHMPVVDDKLFEDFLVLGPLCRYAEDLTTTMQVLSGTNASKLQLDQPVDLSKLNVHYMCEGSNSFTLAYVEEEIKQAIKDGVDHLQEVYNCSVVKEEKFDLSDSCEIGAINLSRLKNVPYILVNPENPKERLNLFVETLKAVFGLSRHKFNVIFFYMLTYASKMLYSHKYPQYKEELQKLKKHFSDTLGTNGVLLYPTFPTAAFHNEQLILLATGVMYPMIFNVLGLPATHIPTGLNKEGMPIGFQVVAAPYQDKLCLAVAKALEKKFGGWIPPSSTPTTKAHH